MSKIHEANRQHWNNQATTWEERLNRDGVGAGVIKSLNWRLRAKHLLHLRDGRRSSGG